MAIKRIYEIQDIGKGVINALSPNNLLLIKSEAQGSPGLGAVLDVDPRVYNNKFISVAQTSGILTDDKNGVRVTTDNFDTNTDDTIPKVWIGRGEGSNTTDASLGFYKNKTVFRDSQNNRGLEYYGNYEANFTDKSLVSKLYVDSVVGANQQKVINYPADFTGTNYTLTNADNGYTIFVNNGATNVTVTLNATITVPNFEVGFIQEGAGTVTFAGGILTNPVGLKIRGSGYQAFIERKLNTSTFYLLGNTTS